MKFLNPTSVKGGDFKVRESDFVSNSINIRRNGGQGGVVVESETVAIYGRDLEFACTLYEFVEIRWILHILLPIDVNNIKTLQSFALIIVFNQVKVKG